MTWLSEAWLRRHNLTSLPGHTPLGVHHESGDTLYVSDEDREVGVYVGGGSGNGKSGELENMAVHDITAGDRAVVFIDYHGDTAMNILAAIPASELSRVFLFDLTDEDWPIALNLFTNDNLESSTSVRVAVNRILHVFTSTWPETVTHIHLPNFVNACVRTLLANPGTTLYDMYRMCTDPAYRQQLVAKVPWDNVKDYWRDFDGLPNDRKVERMGAILARLHQLFMGDTLMANVLGQAPGRLDFRQVIANKEVVLVRLPGRKLAYESRLVGGILLAQLQAAVFAGADIEPEDRLPVSVFVDEFQAIATPDIKVFFDEGRKYRIALTISSQRLSQMEPELKDAAVAAKTIICFRMGLDDGRALAPLFTNTEGVIKPEDVDRHACQRLMDDGSPEPVVQAFVDCYLRPLNGHRRGARIEITTKGFSMRDSFAEVGGVMVGAYDPKAAAQYPKVDDPLPWLDDCFRRAMETGNPGQPIPVLAVAGFANTGPGFWPQVRRLRDDDPILQPGYRMPDNLVVTTQGGEVWAKEPETGREMLLHCIWCIRSVLDYLASHPIGKETAATDRDTAQILRSLPKRAAAVRSGDEQGIIFTLDNPPHVSGPELKQRVAEILNRTHDEYCRPRSEVEQSMQRAPVKQSAPKSRWEQR